MPILSSDRVYRGVSTALLSLLAAAALYQVEKRGWFDRLDGPVDGVIEGLAWFGGTEAFPWITGGAIGLWLGLRFDAWLRRKAKEPLLERARVDLDGLADEAESVSAGIHKLLGTIPHRGPTHPNFNEGRPGVDVDLWWRDKHERNEGLLGEYHRDYATRAWRVIDTAQRYVEVSDSEIWNVKHTSSSAHGLPEMAQLLAAISSRLREVQVPLPPRRPSLMARVPEASVE